MLVSPAEICFISRSGEDELGGELVMASSSRSPQEMKLCQASDRYLKRSDLEDWWDRVCWLRRVSNLSAAAKMQDLQGAM
jgi:hypothetical protein